MDKKTSAHISLRVNKDENNPHGITDTNIIPIDVPCIIAIGGERTISRRDANYYASILNRLFLASKIDDIGIYSAYYQYDDTNRNAERATLFRAAQSRIKKFDTPGTESKYINDLYSSIIKPRISNNERRFSDIDVIKNMRRVVLFTHCHGAAVVRMFQNLMLSEMQKLGYSKQTITHAMKSLLVIQHAPVAPLFRNMFNTVSFMSASDSRMYFHNDFSKYAMNHAEDMAPSYFELGNFFAVYAFTYQMIDEHQIVGLVPNEDQEKLTPYGKIIMTAERNAIINGVRAMQRGTPMPDIRKLIASTSQKDEIKPDFDELRTNGDFFMRIMQNDLKLERKQESR